MANNTIPAELFNTVKRCWKKHSLFNAWVTPCLNPEQNAKKQQHNRHDDGWSGIETNRFHPPQGEELDWDFKQSVAGKGCEITASRRTKIRPSTSG